ncbi:MAG: hypothetical protein WBX20_20850 [Terrimicrobiaceae bacterium]
MASLCRKIALRYLRAYDGGYAEVMLAIPSGLVAIPDDLSSADAAPLLCAGLTTYNALRRSPAKTGDLVAVQGIGGLGHLAVQFAVHMLSITHKFDS